VVAVVDENESNFIAGPVRRISVFMNVFDVHVNRFPVNGVVEFQDYSPGKFLNATLDKASSDNERMSLGIRSARGPVLVRQIAGLVARRIVTDTVLGDAARQGERFGLIRFGSRVDTLLPRDVVARVSVGDRAKAGITVIAEWPT
jgi:phosphatidylserine decarboxylase